jgi:putative DNA primase/helicase
MTYGEATIAKAVERCRDTYNWNRGKKGRKSSAARAKSESAARARSEIPDEYNYPMLEPEGRTEMSIAERFEVAFGDRVRYVASWRAWLIWDGKRWRLDETCEIERMGTESLKALWIELAAASAKTDSEELENAMFGFVRASMKRPVLFNALTLLRSAVAVSVDKLDADPWLFNVQNGTIDLRTGKLRPHDDGDMLTKISPAS